MINQAIHFATEAHAGQLRKVSESPFIFHPLAVACLLVEAGEAEETVIAGLLHDTVEDTSVTMEEVRETFGDSVAQILAGCTEDKTKSWEERKERTIADLARASEEVCIVTCADKIHNLQVSLAGIKEDREAFFQHFKRGYEAQKWYYVSIKDVLEKRIPHHPLLKQYRDLCETIFKD